ncbi:hypothetical protein ACFQ51_29995 [Streptomyces kaempferi]
MELVEEDVNGLPGVTVRIAGTTVAVVAADVRDGLVTDLWLVINPDKLHAWTDADADADADGDGGGDGGGDESG